MRAELAAAAILLMFCYHSWATDQEEISDDFLAFIAHFSDEQGWIDPMEIGPHPTPTEQPSENTTHSEHTNDD